MSVDPTRPGSLVIYRDGWSDIRIRVYIRNESKPSCWSIVRAELNDRYSEVVGIVLTSILLSDSVWQDCAIETLP